MIRQCPDCKRANPADAAFCFFDGKPLATSAGEGSIDFGTLAFPHPFVFASGARCHNFLQLALACQRHPGETIEALRGGFLGGFFGSLGRIDLAMAAKALAALPDDNRALDELIGKLPGSPLRPAQLAVEPLDKNLGVLQISGEDCTFELTLTNKGDRLISGKALVAADCAWLVLGESGTAEKLFQFFDTFTLAVRVPSKRLRAFEKPLKGEITIESNGGNFTCLVEVVVPVKPFPEGVLSGASSPRQVAAKAKANPKEAAVLLENGGVARWYESNGWTYPVQGPTASGIAAVQQFFETLGLVKPPKVELTQSAVSLRGKVNERLEYSLTVVTQEKRAAVAYAVSDQPWLTVGKTVFNGQQASIPLTVASVPYQPGQTLTAQAKVYANGNQRFDVPVTLQVLDEPGLPPPPPPPPVQTAPPLPPMPAPPPPVSSPFAFSAPPPPPPVMSAAESPFADLGSPGAVASVPEPVAANENLVFSPRAAPPPSPPPPPPPAPASSAPAAATSTKRRELLARLLPVGIVLVGLLTAVGRDILFREPVEESLPPIDYANPVLDLRFHDAVTPGGDLLPSPSMRFGMGIPDREHPGKFKTKLTYDEMGRTCNVCVRIDKTTEYLFGQEQGAWKIPIKEPLGVDKDGNRLIGAKATWVRPPPLKITITQYVEIVPAGLSPDGKKRLLDTCLVRYDITNEDTQPHTVGLRFLLDTLIGKNDVVPFTIAGARELCDTMKSFNTPEEVPDYISALEKQDLKNPGTVAHLSLRYGAPLEPPSRVTLGAWPAPSVRKALNDDRAQGVSTRWVVPVASMRIATSSENREGDSAVTMYWDDKELAPGKTRIVGFAYGLGSVTGDTGEGQLGITAGGALVADREFTLTAYVKNPAPGTTATLTLPKQVKLAGGSATESVPPIPAGAASPYSPVTWRLKATRGGVHRVKVSLNTGATSRYRLVIKPADLFK